MKNIFKYSIVLVAFATIFQSCSGCSKSGLKSRQLSQLEQTQQAYSQKSTNQFGKTIIKMERAGGVYQIPVEVNGVNMSFIFDTGASLISISAMEAAFLLKQGKLSEADFRGTGQFIDAKGEISEGTLLNLRTVKIGDRLLTNIEASIVHNMEAPLLFGQSALERFGKVTIDYQKGELIFE